MTLGFGIVGAGSIAPIHAAAIAHTPEARLVAVAARDPARGQAFAEKYACAWHAGYDALLARDDIDVVTVCTPHNLHRPVTLAAAAAGKHVLVEKPMALNTAECDAMIAACAQAGVTLGVIFPSRFEPLSLKLKGALDTGRMGRLLGASAHTVWNRTTEYYEARPWRGRRDQAGGGVLMNQAIHAIDLLLWLTGMPQRVTAQIRTLNHPIEVEDSALAILEYPDGHLGLIQATVNAVPGFPERLEFHGARGAALYYKGLGRLEWHLRDPEDEHVDSGAVSSGAAAPMDISAAGHTAEFLDFAAAIRERRAPLLDGAEGRKSVAVVEAIYRSARENRPVELGSREEA